MGLLEVFSKDEVNYVRYEPPPDVRIDLSALLKFDFSKTLLVYQGIPFIVRASRVGEIFKKDGDVYSQRVAAGFKDVQWHFIDKNSGEMDQIDYILIELVELDPGIIFQFIIDVIFFHELREMYYQRVLNNPRETAHQKARKDERAYAAKFLSLTEKQIYKKFSREFKPVIEKLTPNK